MQQMAPAVPVSGLAVEIVSQARDGRNRFEIRLDPPDLGRVDVRLDIDGQGNVTSRLVVERQDTLDLLRRESSALERALNDAGLKTSNDGLQFSLRDQSSNSQAQRDTGGRFTRVAVPIENASGGDTPSYRLPRVGGLDIRV
jgi:flagellar hook-length control protein FliK